jgi:hypothetical protein
MTLSTQTLHNLSDALKSEVLDYIRYNDRYVSTMYELISDAIHDKLGPVDDDVLTELTFITFDSLTLN